MRQVVSLSHRPAGEMVGPDGLEPSTPRLSSACSNQLSYDPEIGGLCCKELLVLDIYFVRSTETRKLAFPSTIELVTHVKSSSP